MDGNCARHLGGGINLPWLPDGVVAALILLPVPMGMLVVGGPKYHKKHEKLVAAAVVTLLAGGAIGRCLGEISCG